MPGLFVSNSFGWTMPRHFADIGSGEQMYGVTLLALNDGGLVVWESGAWERVGGRVYGQIGETAIYDDGGGAAIYLAGDFDIINGAAARNLAKWDGQGWSEVGGGVTGHVRDMQVFDDGAGPALYLAGNISNVGGMAVSHIARWGGSSWSDVGGGVSAPPGAILQINDLEVFDDGSGPALYAAGYFSAAGGVPARNVAKWDGTRWHPLGAGLGQPIHRMAVLDDPRGRSLFFAGGFHTIGAGEGRALAQWVGTIGQCYADADVNGTLDVFDFLAFQDAFVTLNPMADCEVDGDFDVFDFLCFQDRFIAGCP
jgi:hypothetical protein